MAEPVDPKPDRDPEWAYLSVDVSAERFGDLLGELNRTGWSITGSRERDDDDLDALLVNGGQRRATGWMRIFAKRRF